MSLQNTIDALLSAGCENQKIPGVIACVADDSGVIYEGCAGTRSVDSTVPMSMDTVGLFASMTKAVTGTAAMQLVEQGKLSLDDPAGKVCPFLEKPMVLEGFDSDGKPKLRPAKGTVTLRNLLTHTSGFSYEIWNPDMARELEYRGAGDILSGQRASLDRPLAFDPGTRWDYGIGIDWAGKMVEEVSGMRLGEYFQKNILGPLGMKDTAFSMGDDQKSRLAGMHARTPDGAIVPYPLVLEQEPEQHMGGHALYGALPDYLRFLRMILGKGSLDGTRILEEKTVATMGENHMGKLWVTDMPDAQPYSNAVPTDPNVPCNWGLTFSINTRETPQGRSPGSLSWAGLANSYYWIDPVKRVTGVILTQILPFFDPHVVKLYTDMESAVYQSR